MQRILTMLTLLGLAGCGAEAGQSNSGQSNPGSGVLVIPPQTAGEIDGTWVILITDPFVAGACVTIRNDELTHWFDGCAQPDILLAPAPILYDDTGPWFVLSVFGIGDEFFFLTEIAPDVYHLSIFAETGDFFGTMERF